MINKIQQNNPQWVVESITCDKCKKKVLAKDYEEFQEFVSIRHETGYGNNTFGDDLRIEVDLCQKCFYELFKDIAREI